MLRNAGIDELPLTVTKEQVIYFKPEDPSQYTPDRFPTWLLHHGKSEHYYGFPIYGEPATKAGIDLGGQVVTAESRGFEPDPRITASVGRMIGQFMPGFGGSARDRHIHSEKTCLYTLTPDRDLVIDTVPGHPNVAVAVGAGHAAKYASVLGQILYRLVDANERPAGIDMFRLDRPALTDPEFPKALHFGSTVTDSIATVKP